MSFETLRKTKKLITDIDDFYAKWNDRPENITPVLFEHPSIKRRIYANQTIREKAHQIGPVLSTLSATRYYGDTKVETWQIQNEAVRDSHVPYRLSGIDVDDYLYHARIVALRDEGFRAFADELDDVKNEAQERSRVHWCKKFDDLFTALEEKLIRFDANDIEWEESYGNENWPDVSQTLRDLTNNHIRPLIEQYRPVFQRYLPNQTIDQTKKIRVGYDTPLSDEDKKQQVRQILNPLSGLGPTKLAIMSKEDYTRLIDYVDDLVLSDMVPPKIIPIKQTSISNEHVRYTFYRLHKQLFGTRRIKQHFINFLHQVFTQFEGTAPETTKAKFSTAPKSYDKDFAG